MRNREVNSNEQDYQIFVSFIGQILQPAGNYGALLIKPLFYGRPFDPSLFKCAFILLSALLCFQWRLQGVTVFRTCLWCCLWFPSFSLGSALNNAGRHHDVLGRPLKLNVKIIKSGHNSARDAIWRDARCKGDTHMDRGEWGNDRPRFGVSRKRSAYNIIRVLNIIKLKFHYIV